MTARSILLVTLFVVGASIAAPMVAAEDPELSAYAPIRTLDAGSETAVTVQFVNTAEPEGNQPEVARAVRATLEAGDAPLSVKSGTTAVGEIPNGGVSQADFQVEVDADAEPGTYQLPVEVRYQHDGLTYVRTYEVTIDVEGQARFAVENVESDLSVGEDGSVTFAVTNVGHEVARDAVVRYTGESRNLHFDEVEYAVGDLEPGESTNVTFSGEVSEGAGDGPRRLSYVVEYDTDDGEARTSDPLHARATVGEKRSLFSVAPTDATVEAGSGRAISFEVTNEGEETARNVNAKLFVGDPLSSGDDEAYVAELAPGESASITFQVAASDGALAKSYPVSLDFQYDTEDGDTKLSDTYRAPIDVTRSDDSGLPVSVVAGVVAVGVATILGWTWRRRR
jgi:hypothetical protein